MRVIPGRQVQAAIAELVLGPSDASVQIGDITLHAHQRDGAGRALHLLRTFGGALIADDVGLGKTFLALAVARAFRRPLIVAPASLRTTWTDASERARIPVTIASLEALARGARPGDHDIVVVDEAHHLRNPATRSFAAARALCADTPVVLLSATPVQNRLADLRVIMSLFLGERAHALSADELATMIVRRDARAVASAETSLPTTEPPLWLHPAGDADCLERLLTLPPPIAPADAGDGGALLTYTLIRQWASSRAALVNALRRRVARAHAIEDSLATGRLPSRRELAAWCFAGEAQQMAFSFMAAGPQQLDAERLADQVREHRLATRGVLDWLASTTNPDTSRSDLLVDVARRHDGRRVVVFSEYAETVEALFRLLVPRLRVAMLTHAGGRNAAGRVSRGEILARLAPGSRGSTPERERIDLLLTTDVMSEGVSLHDASVVVHLDLPWNPARLAQRVGRVRRIGSPESSVIVYAMAPPAPAERMLELEQRLKRKVTTAARTIGVSSEILPGFAIGADNSAATLHQDLVAALTPWRQPVAPTDGAVCGAMRSTRRGFIACVRLGGRVRLVGAGDSLTDDPAALGALARSAAGEDAAVDAGEFTAAESAITAWLHRRDTMDVVDLPEQRVARSRRALLRRVEYISRRIPRHARPGAMPMLVAARNMAAAALSAGAERVLDELTRSSLSDTAWLQAIAEFASLHARTKGGGGIVALLLLRPA